MPVSGNVSSGYCEQRMPASGNAIGDWSMVLEQAASGSFQYQAMLFEKGFKPEGPGMTRTGPAGLSTYGNGTMGFCDCPLKMNQRNRAGSRPNPYDFRRGMAHDDLA